ncbi:MAG: hypothetical protein JWO81_2102 [Alphaproteobacteria bacterium]|nr:hypothetical protein [Alphaproteobacteria bacterium]
MYRDWSDFYLLIGSAGSGLIGLLFVVSSLTSGLERATSQRGARLYLTPIIFHLAAIVVLSAVAMVPGVPRAAVVAVAGLIAAAGAAYAAMILHGLLNPIVPEPPHWTDKYFYAVAPGALYLLLGAVAVAIRREAAWALMGEAALALALLLLAIRNAWDLATWLAPTADPAPDRDPSG